jgi:hypothetical protein
VRLEERRTVKLAGVLAAIAIVGAVLFFPSLYVFGLWLAPPRPVPAAVPAPALLREALWARANGDPSTELRPVNPIAIVQHVACTELAENHDLSRRSPEEAKAEDPKDRAQRLADCRKHLPAIQGVEYLSGVHMRDHHFEPSFLTGIRRVATAVWMTRSWTREEFLDTLAARSEFGPGWRGVEAASRGYFDRAAAELTLPQAAALAAFVGDRGIDPWCDPEAATGMRDRILQRLRENGAIDEAAWHTARSARFELAAPPPAHRCPR